MKKYLFFLLYIMSNFFAFGQSVNVIQVNEKNESKHSYLVSCIDSLIHDLERELQILYIGGETYEFNIEDIDSVSFGKEEVKVFYLPNYIEGTETYFFSNGCVVNISEDSINGYTVFVDSLDFKANKWDEDKALAIYCDSLFRPIMTVTNKGRTQFSYDDIGNTINVRAIDSYGDIYELQGVFMENLSASTRSYVRKRASTEETEMTRLYNGAKNALEIVNLVRYASQRDMNNMNKIYGVLAPHLFPDGIPKDVGQIIKDGIDTYLEKRIFGKALGIAGLLLDYVQLLSDLRDWIVKQEIGDITPRITNLEQVDNGSVDLRIEFSGDGFLTSTNDTPLFHINYWQEVDGRKVGFTHSTSSQNANYGFRMERISNLNGGNWAFQVIVYPSRFSVSNFLVANYNYRSNIMRIDMGRIYISELSQTSDYYSDNTVTLSMRALLKYQSDEDEVILSAYNDYGLYVKRGNKTPELYSVKQNGGLEFYVNFEYTKNELDFNYNLYKATPKEDIKFGVYTINGYGLRNYYDEQSVEMSYNKAPKAETGGLISVGITDAVVKCSYNGCAFWDVLCGIEYGFGNIKERGIVVAEYDGEQEIHLTDLTPDKTYSYRAYYEKYGERKYGEPKTFKTKKKETPDPEPVVITGTHYNETATTATIECTYNRVPAGADCGYFLSEEANSPSGGERLGTVEGTKVIPLPGLEPSTTYYYQAYIKYDGKTYLGGEQSFTTLTPIATTGNYSNVTKNSAVVECSFENVPAGAKCYVFLQWEENGNYKMITYMSSDGLNQKIPCTGLQPSMTYYYTAAISYNGKEYMGEEKSFTTTTPPTPIATTGDYSNVTMTSATVYCTYENVPEGGICGVEYKWDGGSSRMPAGSGNGARSITLSGLQPITTYTYCAYIEADGQTYYGVEKKFTTNPPDLSGTWKCTSYTERGTVYETWTIIFNKDGSGSASNSSNTYNDFSWEVGAGGSVNFGFFLYSYSYGLGGWNSRSFEGVMNNLYNPTSISGKGQYNMGNAIVDNWSEFTFVMTR